MRGYWGNGTIEQVLYLYISIEIELYLIDRKLDDFENWKVDKSAKK